MSGKRFKNHDWGVNCDEGDVTTFAGATLAVLMDIRDELQALNRKAGCHRIPRALDALHELGIEARRRKRNRKKRRT